MTYKLLNFFLTAKKDFINFWRWIQRLKGARRRAQRHHDKERKTQQRYLHTPTVKYHPGLKKSSQEINKNKMPQSKPYTTPDPKGYPQQYLCLMRLIMNKHNNFICIGIYTQEAELARIVHSGVKYLIRGVKYLESLRIWSSLTIIKGKKWFY